MEETNFYRDIPAKTDKADSEGLPPARDSPTNFEPPAGSDSKKEASDTNTRDFECISFEQNSKKSYWSKLKVFDKKALQYPNRLKGMILRPLIFLTFPVVFYAGFSYGSNLIWFNVLNGTASLILSGEPYGFSSSIVGLCYFAPLIGVSLG